MQRTAAAAIVLACAVAGAFGQFQFFEQMFGQGNPGQQQRQPPTHAAQWASQADAVPCASYLCPDTLVCVANPAQCPCPSSEDVRCVIPDQEDRGGATVLCVRGATDCADVERLSRKFGK